MENDVEQLKSEIGEFERAEEDAEEDIAEATREINALKDDQHDSQKQLEALEEELKKAVRKMEQYELGQKSRSRKKTDAKREVKEWQGKVDSLQQKLADKETEKKEALQTANERMFYHTLLARFVTL